MRARSVLAFLATAATSVALLPAASAQTDPLAFCDSVWCNVLAIVMFIVISLVSRYYKSKKEREARERAISPPMGTIPTSGTPSGYQSGSPPVPMGYADRASDYSNTSPESNYSPIIQVRTATKYRKATNPGVCPRCGSSNVKSYGSGEHKCLDCKKIYYGGRD
jgi:hypothetical protein